MNRGRGRAGARLCLLLLLGCVTGFAVAGCLGSSGSGTTSRDAIVVSGDAGRITAREFVCSMADYLEPFDNRDLLEAFYKFVSDHEVEWSAIGFFGALTYVKHAPCSEPLRPKLNTLAGMLPPVPSQQLLRVTPGYILSPAVSLSSATSGGLDEVTAGLRVSWITGGSLPPTRVDIRLDPDGRSVPIMVPATDGVYQYVFPDQLALGAWYQEALRVDDTLGQSSWVCSEPFTVQYSPAAGSYYLVSAPDSALELALYPAPGAVAPHQLSAELGIHFTPPIPSGR